MDRTIQLWTVRLQASRSEREELAGLLSPDEQERMQRFRFEHLQTAFAVSRAALRILLGRHFGMTPGAIRFTYGPHGKPYLEHSNLHFNSSHTDEWYACALTWNCQLGLDIERIKQLPDAVAIARSQFCPEELADLLAEKETEQQASFFRGWTRKEAYLKAVGTGLATNLNGFRVSLRAAEPPALLQIGNDRKAAHEWTLQDVVYLPDHAGALAYRDRPRPVDIYPSLTAAELLGL